MNYIKHLSAFFELAADDNRLNSSHVSMYLAIFQFWNAHRFENPLSISRNELMSVSKIASKSTYQKCINELSRFGYLQYMPSNNPFKGSLVHMYDFEKNPRLAVSADQLQEIRDFRSPGIPRKARVTKGVRRNANPSKSGTGTMQPTAFSTNKEAVDNRAWERKGTASETGGEQEQARRRTKGEDSEEKVKARKRTRSQYSEEQLPGRKRTKKNESDGQAAGPLINSINISKQKTDLNLEEKSQIPNFKSQGKFQSSNSKSQGKFQSSNSKFQSTDSKSQGKSLEDLRLTGEAIPRDVGVVRDFFLKHNETVTEAEKFYNYFGSVGWVVGGKKPMKDWQAAARNWMLNKKSYSNESTGAAKGRTTTGNDTAGTVKDYQEPL